MSEIKDTLAERHRMYGSYANVSMTAQALKEIIRSGEASHLFTAPMRESLDMIANKLARLCNGDPTIVDHWHDIAGYATLVENALNGVEL